MVIQKGGKMTNIEVHGLHSTGTRILKQQIIRIFGGKPYANKIRVTTFSSHAVNCQGIDTPFIRLFSTSEILVSEIIKKLKELGVDIEYVELKAFFPRNDTTAQ
jgi:hypothetical protein